MQESNCVMTNRLVEEGNERMSPQETEAVLELWAKRQRETEALRSRATVGDLAEAMSIPQAEVAALLNEIRRDPNRSEEMRQKRNRNRAWIAVGVVGSIIWLVCVIGFVGYFFAKKGGAGASVITAPPTAEVAMNTAPAFVSEGGAATAAAPAPMEMAKAGGSNDFAQQLPKGVTVNLTGYSVEGTASFTGLSEDSLHETLQQIVYHVAKPLSTSSGEQLNESLILQAFLDSSDANVKNLLRFEDFKVFGPGGNITTKLPIALVSDTTLQRLVGEEQSRRLTILANQILRMGTTKLSR